MTSYFDYTIGSHLLVSWWPGAGQDVRQQLLENFCWVEGTFTLPKALLKAIDKEVPAPGVEQFYEKDEVLPHSYYQWVCVVLFLQSLCFYITRALWKGWERGRIKNLMNDLNKVILKEEEKTGKRDSLVTQLVDSRGKNNAYAFRYFICEVVNFFNVIIQMVFINWFLGGEFSKYGINVFNYIDRDPNVSEDPMSRVFPKLTKCTFRQYGPSGDIKRFDNLCLLPQNILNEKLYIILWFWLYVLVIASGIMLFLKAVIIYCIDFIIWVNIQPKYFDTILSRCGYGDWFVLYLLGKNLDTMHYRDVIIELSKKLDELPTNRFEDEFDSSESKV
ncbi:unnamed protein product [Oppiella nova]|uniref:Innexin n=1 Tax=Oppiella nova TaxID=334625 RepID=A0A7R9L9R3_9ACAR|nr:unnamed protein product [Oppiella nova]CAG2160326.1 unnamed protein product [Oppiella nova]